MVTRWWKRLPGRSVGEWNYSPSPLPTETRRRFLRPERAQRDLCATRAPLAMAERGATKDGRQPGDTQRLRTGESTLARRASSRFSNCPLADGAAYVSDVFRSTRRGLVSSSRQIGIYRLKPKKAPPCNTSGRPRVHGPWCRSQRGALRSGAGLPRERARSSAPCGRQLEGLGEGLGSDQRPRHGHRESLYDAQGMPDVQAK